jgi:hypothetical protein
MFAHHSVKGRIFFIPFNFSLIQLSSFFVPSDTLGVLHTLNYRGVLLTSQSHHICSTGIYSVFKKKYHVLDIFFSPVCHFAPKRANNKGERANGW